MITLPALYGTDHREEKGEEGGQEGALAQVQAKVLKTERDMKVLVTQSCLTLCSLVDCSRQVPLSMGFSRQEYWSGLPFPSPGDLPDPVIELWSPSLQADSLLSEPPGKPMVHRKHCINVCYDVCYCFL